VLYIYPLFRTPAAPFPSFRSALAAALGNFSITTTCEAIRTQPVSTVNQTDVGGSITARLTLKQPFHLNALASVNLPFNTTVDMNPNVTLQLSGAIGITGDFIFRSWKKTDSLVQIGIYKKRGTTLSANFTAAAGIGADIGTSDVLGPLLTRRFLALISPPRALPETTPSPSIESSTTASIAVSPRNSMPRARPPLLTRPQSSMKSY